MPLIAWSEEYSIGVPHIDEHHQHLFFLSNSFYDIFVKATPYKDMGPLFDDLIDYAIYHFAAEEQLMHEHEFPNYNTHKQEHENFIKRVIELEIQSNRNNKILLIEIVVFLHTWLQDHIMLSDAQFGQFLAHNHNDA